MAKYASGSIRLYHRVSIRREVSKAEREDIWIWLTTAKEARGKFSGDFGDDIDPVPHFRFTNQNTAFLFKLRFG
ncbi:MAG: hypothetical protein EOP83_19985 [Verrucomicrobiaceae bacterium]|nr:MAG: hypothetical protein EOP83_19985 [Verrucomicrobiaceae bacterium]